MIRSLILDVDGVLVGDRAGFNFPDPHAKVIAALRAVRQTGVYISLCTAKPAFAIEKIIQAAHLNNVHITDGGAAIIDPIDHDIAAEHSIPKALAADVAGYYRRQGVYQEFYSPSDYFIIAGTQCDLTAKHALTLQREPQAVADIDGFLGDETVVKLFLIAQDEQEKQHVARSFAEQFSGSLTLSWTLHPNTLPWQFGIVTAKGISKQNGAREIAQHLQVPLADILGVGDTAHDWQFIQLCGYAAAMGNATGELKAQVMTRGAHGFIAPPVNENGVIEVFRHFGVL